MSEHRGIDRREVLRIARLAHLELDGDEVERLAGELSKILDYVARLESLDLEGVPPHGRETASRLRDDTVLPSLGTDRALDGAPDRAQGYFKVPRVID